jgi:DNA-binding NtrC family response regulator
MRESSLHAAAVDAYIAGLTLEQATVLFQAELIRVTMTRNNGRREVAARRLDVHRNTLLRHAIKNGLYVHPRRKAEAQP